MLHPAEQTHSSLIELDSVIELAFIVKLISFFSQLLVGHESAATFESSHLLVVLSVIEEGVLQVNWKLVENFSGGSWLG